jgi:hypothetical protein
MPSFTNNSLAILSSPHTGFSRAILRISARSSTGIRGRPGRRHFHRQNSRHPARCHRIIVLGCTTTSAGRHSKNLARIAKLSRVAASIRRGRAPRSLNEANCRRRNRFSASIDCVGLNRRIARQTASARSRTAILMSATTPYHATIRNLLITASGSNNCGVQDTTLFETEPTADEEIDSPLRSTVSV